jgi:DMSO/TMAO reductase YedYZ molybdopterin-dependent catalytic subunit
MPQWMKPLSRGLLAGVLAVTLSFVLRTYTGTLFLPEVGALTLFSSVPGELESQAVQTLGVLAKYLTFYGAVAVNVLVYGVVGVGLFRLAARLPRNWYPGRALLSGFVAYAVLLGLTIAVLARSEILSQPAPLYSAALGLVPPSLLFGLAFGSFAGPSSGTPIGTVQPVKIGTEGLRRRGFLRRSLAAGAVVGAGTVGLAALLTQPRPAPAPLSPAPETPPGDFEGPFQDPRLGGLVASEVTPNDVFYKVQVDIFDPIVNPAEWRLRLTGLVANPLELSYEEIQRLPSVEQYTTLTCVSNEIGGDLIGNAKWKGVPLRTVLEAAGVTPGARYVVFKCHDNYTVGISLEKALGEGTLLAYEMNEVPLPAGHGFPLRAVVPGIYGMMNAKWIREIELVDSVYEGFWQRRGWTNDATIQTLSMIRHPQADAPVTEATRLAGIAFGGDRGIAKVEVSTDGGQTWTEATVKEPLSESSWVLWAIEWRPAQDGRYKVVVRATDKAGQIQTAERRRPFPAGATGYHTHDKEVRLTLHE